MLKSPTVRIYEYMDFKLQYIPLHNILDEDAVSLYLMLAYIFVCAAP